MNNNNLPNEEIKELYKKYFNIGQVGLLDKFEFSKEKIVKAKGSYIYTSNGEKILDITSDLEHRILDIIILKLLKKELNLQQMIKWLSQDYFSMKI